MTTTTTKRAPRPRRTVAPQPVVPGADGIKLTKPVRVADVEFTPADGKAECGCPIGAALAAELAKKAGS
jgi:hypothetical protein